MDEYVKKCKIHGNLTIEQTSLNRRSSNGKTYLRCRICRNEQARKYLNNKYITTPKKHEKHKLPSYVCAGDKPHAYTIKHRFKLNISDYNKMLERQNNLCAICKKPETQLKKKYNKIKMLSVDHCHKTGKIRGLLCHKCNTGIGSLCESRSILQSAINYLLSHES